MQYAFANTENPLGNTIFTENPSEIFVSKNSDLQRSITFFILKIGCFFKALGLVVDKQVRGEDNHGLVSI